MNDSPTLWQKFTNLPRAAQWALIAAVSILGYLAYTDYVWAIVVDWNKQADAIEMRIQDVNSKGRINIARMSPLIRGIGPVEEPQKNINDAGAALRQTINAILKRNSVSNDDFRASRAVRLPTQTLANLINGTNKRVESLSVILKFEASVNTTMAIISELESSPDIESISDVRLTKISGAKKLSVRLTMVAWVYSTATSRGGGGLR